MTSRPLPLLLVALLLLSSLAPLASAGEAWTKETGSAITAVATDEYGDRIFVGTESGMVYCYDAGGSVVWSRSLASITTLDVSQTGDIVRVYSDGPGEVYSLNGATGDTIWNRRITEPYGYSISMPRDGSLSIEGGATSSISEGWSLIQVYDADGASQTFNTAAGTRLVTASGDGLWVVTAQAGTGVLRKYSLANVPGWVRPYASRISHTINGSPSGTVTDYPIEIIVHKGAGTNSGPHVYLSDIRDDFNDVAFGDASGNAYPYYLVDKVDGSYAVYRVQIPEIPTTGTTMYVYYNDPWLDAPFYPSDPSVVLFADDFNDGTLDPVKWTSTVGATGQLQETGGYLELQSDGTSDSDVTVISNVYPNQHIRVDYDINFLSTYDATNKNRNRFIQWMCPGEHWVGDNHENTVIQGLWSDVGAWTGIPVDLDAYQRMTILFNPSTSARWILGDINMTNPTPVISSTRVRLSTGDPGEALAGHMRLNWVVVTKEVENPPTHGAWGSSEDGITFQTSKTLDGTIIDIDAPETGDWVAVSTTTKTYIIEITDSGFGTVYSADRTGTPYAVAIANNGANTIEGRGILADIFRFDGVQTGTYTAGGPVRAVAVAQKNGLYAAAGSDDGKYYIFSKDESSSWYLLHASDSEDPVTAIAMSWRGEIAVIGRADGSVILYTTTDAPPPDSQMTVYIIKDGQPYIGKPVSVSTADVSDPDKWTPLYNSLRTDSDGKIVISTHTGHYYQININNGEKIVVIQASSATPIHSVVFRSPLIYEKYNYDAQYNASSQAIEMAYTDNEGPATVSWSIVRTDTYSEVYSHTISGATTATATYPVSEPDISYKVNVKVQRSSGGSIQNMWFITPQNASPLALPFWDENIQNAVFIIFLMILGGVFYYSTGAKGALIVALVAALFRYFSWITVPWFWVIAAVVFAFLANIAEGA